MSKREIQAAKRQRMILYGRAESFTPYNPVIQIPTAPVEDPEEPPAEPLVPSDELVQTYSMCEHVLLSFINKNP